MRLFLLGSIAALALIAITAVVLDRATIPVPGHVDVEMDRLPIHLLFVDAKSRAAHGVIEPSGAASVHLCT